MPARSSPRLFQNGLLVTRKFDSALNERWSSAQVADVNDQILRASRARDPSWRPTSPFGRTAEGLDDLRGLTIKVPIKYLAVRHVDLSQCTLEMDGGLTLSDFVDCRLDRISLQGRFLTRLFERCSFRWSSLQDVRPGERFVDCDFSNAKLNRAMARGAHFVRCDFSAADLRGAHLMSCTFDNCRFDDARFGNGSLAGSRFIGPIDTSKFKATILDDVKLL